MKAFIDEKRFGEKVIFRNAVFDIPRNCRTAILGPSGCGKTTLMRMLSGLDHDYAGHIDGLPELPVVLFQEDRLSERISVMSNMMAVSPDRRKAERILADLSLGGEDRSPVHELSGGMKRRVAIARILMLDYDWLFLDEPFRGLDDDSKRRAAALIGESAEGKPLVLITHDRDDLPLLGVSSVIELG